MATTYTSLLGFALPTTGELSGTWGDVVNDYITKYVDAAVAGAQTISGSQTSVTLSTTNGSALSQAGAGATGSAQYQIINCTGNPASLLTVTAPATSKSYIVINATSTSQSVKIVGAGPTTGVTIVSGEKAIVAWSGSDFVKVASTVVSPAGATTQVQYNNAGSLAGSANLTFDGTTLTAANFADSSLTSGRVTYASTGGNLTDSTNLLFDGTKLTAASLIDSSLTSGRVTYATTSGELTDSANLLFNGTTLTANTLALTNALSVANGGTGLTAGTSGGVPYFSATNTIASSAALTANQIVLGGGAGAAPSTSNLLATSAAVTTGTYIKALGFADTVTALGNSGTATNIDVTSGGVFTATLTGNCTFTLRYPVSSGASSFTLILTNDATPSRTVAWAGGSFKFPGGAAALSRSTAANAVDVWVFFTPDGGTTWYGNIAMKNMTA